MSATGNKSLRTASTALLLAAALLASCAPIASADDAPGVEDVLADFYGNTLMTKDDGIVSHFWYKADHTFNGSVPAFSLVIKGTWSQNPDGTICRVFDPPFPTMKNPDCGPMLVRKPGDVADDGKGHKEKLVEGIQ